MRLRSGSADPIAKHTASQSITPSLAKRATERCRSCGRKPEPGCEALHTPAKKDVLRASPRICSRRRHGQERGEPLFDQLRASQDDGLFRFARRQPPTQLFVTLREGAVCAEASGSPEHHGAKHEFGERVQRPEPRIQVRKEPVAEQRLRLRLSICRTHRRTHAPSAALSRLAGISAPLTLPLNRDGCVECAPLKPPKVLTCGVSTPEKKSGVPLYCNEHSASIAEGGRR